MPEPEHTHIRRGTARRLGLHYRMPRLIRMHHELTSTEANEICQAFQAAHTTGQITVLSR